ncbi:MAG TPA: SPOR domain-containing protein [Blastocatellia bacterium]|nr:SPOR domain-containing protein [Blastocatellia bacterium]
MKASPFSLLIIATLLLGTALSPRAQSGQYTVQIDSMTAQDAAEGKVQQLKSQGQNAYWLKSSVPGQGIRYRVRIGRFPSRAAAQSYGARLKQQGIAADFFVALFEGASSPLGSAEPVKKVEPPPALATAAKPAAIENKAAGTKPALPTEPKAAESKTPVSVPSATQRQREVKSTATPVNSTSEKPLANTPANGSTVKPIVAPSATPTPPTNNAAPKSVPVTPSESKPLQSKPPVPSPLDDNKPPRDKKASNEVSPSATNAATAVATTAVAPPVNRPVTEAPKTAAATTAASTSAVSFQRFEERSYGYSFEHPNYWSGGRLNPEELQAQRIDAGAVFRSQEDVAFMNAIWNSLKNANSPAYDNNLIVDLVIKSLSSGTGLQGLSEISRRMVQEGDQIKTFVDLRTLFRQPRANQPLEFQGKAVIIRANTGILLVVTFYSKDSAPSMIAAADRIIGSARVP